MIFAKIAEIACFDLCIVFQQPLVHLVRSDDFHYFLLHSFCVDSGFLRSHHNKNSDDAKTEKGKTRLAIYAIGDAKHLEYSTSPFIFPEMFN